MIKDLPRVLTFDDEEIVAWILEVPELDGNRQGHRRTTEDQQEVTRGPSQVISGPGDKTRPTVWLRFSVDETGKLVTWCKYCNNRLDTVLQIYQHSCQV